MKKILLVNNDVKEAELFFVKLAADGHQITLTNSTKDAINVIRDAAGEFDLVVSDDYIPSTEDGKIFLSDGLEMSGIIKKEFPAIPILIFSNLTTPGTGALNYGIIDGLLQRPLEMQQVFLTVNQLLESSNISSQKKTENKRKKGKKSTFLSAILLYLLIGVFIWGLPLLAYIK